MLKRPPGAPDVQGRQHGWRFFVPKLFPFRWQLGLAVLAMLLDAMLTVWRPWPLKVVVDRMIAMPPKPSRVPVLGRWIDGMSLDPTEVLYGACGATLFIALSTGLLTYYFTRVLGDVGAERIAEVLSTRTEVFDRPHARLAPRFEGRIQFDQVSFEYQPGQPVLSHIELEVRPGEKVAIMGTTGAGKSTLVSLIPRLYDPTQGSLRIDGEDIRNYPLNSLRDQISLVLQDSLLFSGSIRENIAFGRPAASDEEIVAAAVQANAHEFIERLPDGYETLVAERGATLSGGQKQRIAIARAVLRNAPILILDEPTSGLDAASERIVMESLEKAAAGRTTLMIAHRFATICFADRIVLVENGRIVENGSHEALMASDARYASLFRRHQQAFRPSSRI